MILATKCDGMVAHDNGLLQKSHIMTLGSSAAPDEWKLLRLYIYNLHIHQTWQCGG